MDRSGRSAAFPCGRLAVAVAAALLSGCTMCPDPYDYSGPVPNGSVPQNNFRARSNGILPIGVRPMPWPPLVKQGGAGDEPTLVAVNPAGRGTPTLADPAVESAMATGATDPAAEPMSVLVTAVEPDRRDIASDAAAAPVSEPMALQPVVAVDDPVEPAVEVPPLAETPGWRSRQAR